MNSICSVSNNPPTVWWLTLPLLTQAVYHYDYVHSIRGKVAPTTKTVDLDRALHAYKLQSEVGVGKGAMGRNPSCRARRGMLACVCILTDWSCNSVPCLLSWLMGSSYQAIKQIKKMGMLLTNICKSERGELACCHCSLKPWNHNDRVRAFDSKGLLTIRDKGGSHRMWRRALPFASFPMSRQKSNKLPVMCLMCLKCLRCQKTFYLLFFHSGRICTRKACATCPLDTGSQVIPLTSITPRTCATWVATWVIFILSGPEIWMCRD